MAKTKKKSAPAKKSTPAKKVLAKPAKKAAPKTMSKATPKKAAPKATPTKKAPVKPTAKPSVKTQTATTTAKKPETTTNFKSFLKPLDDRIVVLMSEMDRMTAGGLYIPDTVADVSGNFQGKVMAIGRGHMNKKGKVKPLDVEVGDKVVFSQFSGSRIEMDGNNIMIIRESDVLGIVK